MVELTVLTEDVIGFDWYLSKNGLYPTNIVYRADEMIDKMSFASKDSLFLVVLHGLTRFPMASLDILFESLSLATKQGAVAVVMTDIPIKSPHFQNTSIQLVEYVGDLFFGTYTFFKGNKKVTDTIAEDKLDLDILNNRVKMNKIKPPRLRSDFWAQFGEFTTPIKPDLGSLPPPPEYPTNNNIDGLISVDLLDN